MNAPPPYTGQPITDATIIINDIVLTSQQKEEFEKLHNQKLVPSKYWYDKNCGLFGITGQPALGYLRPGHDFGTLARNASNGNSHVLINNRELTQFEWMMLSQIVGTPVMPGSYWLDAQGNAGMQGSSFPLVNIFVAQQNARKSGGNATDGDNFWTSRFSAGNAYSDGSAGYVNVDGIGPVGWG